jgi:hypothetical protein
MFIGASAAMFIGVSCRFTLSVCHPGISLVFDSSAVQAGEVTGQDGHRVSGEVRGFSDELPQETTSHGVLAV